MEFKLKYGLLGLRTVKLRFDLAALKAATVAARMDLGEFLTSKKLSDTQRLFFQTYGAWLKGESVSAKSLKRFGNWYRKLNVTQIEKIKSFKVQSEIVSREFRQALEKAGQGKKKT